MPGWVGIKKTGVSTLGDLQKCMLYHTSRQVHMNLICMVYRRLYMEAVVYIGPVSFRPPPFVRISGDWGAGLVGNGALGGERGYTLGEP